MASDPALEQNAKHYRLNCTQIYTCPQTLALVTALLSFWVNWLPPKSLLFPTQYIKLKPEGRNQANADS
jgi:hypothetical protein